MKLTTQCSMLLLCSIFFAPQLFSQTLQIGNADGVNNTVEFPTPYGDLYEGMRAQYLYTAAELTSKGATAGFISTVGFLVADPNGTSLENFSIRLSNTATVSLSATGWEPAGTVAYDTSLWQPTGGSNLHLLETPFFWNGTSNLLIEVCFNPTAPEAGNFSTLNARTAWSTNLPFNASRTFAADDEATVCGTSTTAALGTATNRPVLLLRFSCQPPSNLTLSALTSNSAGIQFSPSPDGNLYLWEVGLQGFTPGTGTQLFGGLTSNTSFGLSGLNALISYDVYVRTNCGNANSAWIGPLTFKTLAGCGDDYYDTGGFLGAYQNNENYVEVLCADSVNHVTTLHFSTILLGAGDTLRIFNGTSPSWPLMATFTGSSIDVGPFTATTASGCIAVQFKSDAANISVGWLGDISCGRPDSCFVVLEPDNYPVAPFFDRAGFRWRPMFGAKRYDWRAGVRPYFPNQPTSLKDTTLVPEVVVTGLEDATLYDFWVRVMCKNGDSSNWVKVPFFTPPNCNAGVLNCGNSTWAFTSAGTGIYQDPVCAIPVPGKEKIVRFTAPNTRNHNLEVLSTNATGTYVGYFYKPVSLGCGPENWQCIDDFNQPGVESFGPLTAGTEYYIRFESQNPAVLVSQTIRITGCFPENDEAWAAYPLTVDAACSGNVYSNEGAGITINEPVPDADPSDGTAGRWQNGIDRTVWFKFTAPPSGTVRISTENIPQGSNYDTQIALYRAIDPEDYTTFTLLESDEDSGEIGLGFNAILTYTGLLPGAEYYIQVDDYGTSSGTFCIEVLNSGPRSLDTNCGEGPDGHSVGSVNGTVAGGDRWYNIYTEPNIFEIGQLVAAIKPGPQNLDTVWCQINNIDTIPVDGGGQAYMPAYFNFKSKVAPIGPVTLRLFFYDAEFNALKVKANQPAATIEDLNATHYRGVFQNCLLPGNVYTNPAHYELLTAVDGVACGTSGTFYVELEVDSMGEVGVHLGAFPLPLELRSFNGKIAGSTNLLEWETASERGVQWHIVERSADNVHWREVGRRPAAGNSLSPLRYSLDDRDPLSRAYYRLRSVDFDGRTAYSQSILLDRKDEAFGIAAAFPSPTIGGLTVQYIVENEENVSLRVLDFTGKTVLEQHAEASKGLNQMPVPLDALPAGTYVVMLVNSSGLSSAVRIVKK